MTTPMTAATPSDVVMEPCPFCGAKMFPYAETAAVWLHESESYGSRKCLLAEIEVPDDPEGRAAWNRRASDPLRGEMVEALKRLASKARIYASNDDQLWGAYSQAIAILTKAESLNAEGPKA